jgi:phage baseplate assembly protein W
MAIHDANYLFTSAAEQDVKKYTEGNALSARIQEWLATPEGTVAHDPSWGHNLTPYKFEPLTKGIGTFIEMSITRKLPLDIEDIELKGIKVEILGIDKLYLQIIHQFGTDSLEVQL